MPVIRSTSLRPLALCALLLAWTPPASAQQVPDSAAPAGPGQGQEPFPPDQVAPAPTPPAPAAEQGAPPQAPAAQDPGAQQPPPGRPVPIGDQPTGPDGEPAGPAWGSNRAPAVRKGDRFHLSLRADAQWDRDYLAINAHLALEVARFEVGADLLGFTFRDPTGGLSTDAQLLELYAGYAVLAGPHGRLRAELGITNLAGELIGAAGPSVGLSGVLGLGESPFGLEATARYTPVPFSLFEWTAGAGAALGPFHALLGWRMVFVDEHGTLSGFDRPQLVSGPFLGVGVTL